VNPGSHEASLWCRRFFEATRKSGAPESEVVKAIREYFGRMQERVGFVKRLHQAGAATQTDVLNAQYEALEAKARLEEELGN
jgi:hypothetical protein